VKPGWKTTEFWLAALTSVGAVAASIAGILPPQSGAVATAISTAAYSLARGFAKNGQ
jgi:hypothetical protein